MVLLREIKVQILYGDGEWCTREKHGLTTTYLSISPKFPQFILYQPILRILCQLRWGNSSFGALPIKGTEGGDTVNLGGEWLATHRPYLDCK